MSRFLLDTNVVVALVNKTVDRLPLRVRQVLESPDRLLAASVVSPWEIAIKVAAGRVQLRSAAARLADLLPAHGCTVLPMTIDHALEVAHPEPATKDPFDRLLLAVCACEGMKLLTTDRALAGHRLVW
jgi:PIN domain nuclease of toxin-antitoxin system